MRRGRFDRAARPLVVVAFIAILVVASAAAPRYASATANVPARARTTIGVPGEPQVVRIGTRLAEIDPSRPNRYLTTNWEFAGVDAYELNTYWGINLGCGSMESQAQIDNLFSSLGPGSVARVWFFQQFALDQKGNWNWTAIDRVVASAQSHGVHIVATLGNQDGTCDDGVWKSPSWYETGWTTLDKVAGDDKVPYSQWVRTVVSRYAGSPAILAWEPINEPRPDTCTLPAGTPGWSCWGSRTCPDSAAASAAVRSFFDQVGAEIRSADPNHLISDGALAQPGCGFADESQFDNVVSSPGIDLISIHDYTGTDELTVADLQWFNDEARQIRKPVWVGENGDTAGSGDISTPAKQQARLAAYTTKVETELGTQGIVGWLYWYWGPTGPNNLVGQAPSGAEELFPLVHHVDG